MEKICENAQLQLAIASVPMQCFEHLYNVETALERGTIFKALDLPFTAYRGYNCGR